MRSGSEAHAAACVSPGATGVRSNCKGQERASFFTSGSRVGFRA